MFLLTQILKGWGSGSGRWLWNVPLSKIMKSGTAGIGEYFRHCPFPIPSYISMQITFMQIGHQTAKGCIIPGFLILFLMHNNWLD